MFRHFNKIMHLCVSRAPQNHSWNERNKNISMDISEFRPDSNGKSFRYSRSRWYKKRQNYSSKTDLKTTITNSSKNIAQGTFQDWFVPIDRWLILITEKRGSRLLKNKSYRLYTFFQFQLNVTFSNFSLNFELCS